MKKIIQNIEKKIQIFFFQCAYVLLVAECIDDKKYSSEDRRNVIDFGNYLTTMFEKYLDNKKINN